MPHVVKRADVRMLERRNRARLALETLLHVGFRGQMLWQNLDGDVASQPRISRAVHLSHPARAYRAGYLIRPQFRSGRQRQADPCHAQSNAFKSTAMSKSNSLSILRGTLFSGPGCRMHLARQAGCPVQHHAELRLRAGLWNTLDEKEMLAIRRCIEVVPRRVIVSCEKLLRAPE